MQAAPEPAIPELAPSAAPAVEPEPLPLSAAVHVAPETGPSAQRIAGYVTAAAGVAGIGVGIVLGLMRNAKLSQLGSYCDLDAGRCTIAAGDSTARANIDALRSDARAAATGATLGFALGGAALLGGIVLVLTAPSPRADVALQVGPGSLTLNARMNGL